MRVKCVINDLSSLPKDVLFRLERAIHIEGPITDLELGETYTVHAIKEVDEGVWVFLHTIKENDYPYPFPIEFFEIVDNSLPADWCINFHLHKGKSSIKLISFAEWVNDPSFYERLIDDDKEIASVYRKKALCLSH